MKRIMIAITMGMSLFVFGAQAQSVEAVRYFDAGIQKLEIGQNLDALLLLEKAKTASERSQSSPEFRAMIHYNLGVCLYRLGETAAAGREYRTALKLKNGRYGKAVHALGVIRANRRIDSARAVKQ